MENRQTEKRVSGMQKAIFYNGQIVTMDESCPTAQAVLVVDGIIQKVGSDAEVLALNEEGITLRNLEGKALLPGFIDPHSHFTAVAYSLLMVNAKPSPSGPCDTKELLLQEFRKACEAGDWSNGDWLMGMGYDSSAFPDKAPVTRLDLDTVSTDVPISCIHSSGHMAVLNTLGLQKLGYWGQYSVPAGGTVELLPDGTPSGLVTELAYLAPEVQAKMKAPAFEQVLEAMEKASDLYASFGITTGQDARVGRNEAQLLAAGGSTGAIKVDVVGIVAPDAADSLLTKGQTKGNYINHIRMGGCKIFLDGSPQGKTAWLSKPYRIPPEGYDPDYNGFPLYKDTEVITKIKTCLQNGWQLNTHCNGDAAAEQLIRCYERAMKETGICKDLRPIMIHAQTVRADQLDRMAKIGMTASFFLDHVYYWGDYHYESVLGPERAENISPIRWALDRGIHCTMHQDSPVVNPNTMLAVHNAVNRKTVSGRVLGENQRISVQEALKTVTLDGAYQIFEENEKGSITPGKLADLVILGENPLTADPETLKDIPVQETIKEGKTIYI